MTGSTVRKSGAEVNRDRRRSSRSSKTKAEPGAVVEDFGSGPLSGSAIGQAAHQVIARLLREGVREPSPEVLFRAVASHPVCQNAPVYRQAARQRLTAAVAVYFRFLLPDAGWGLVGDEVQLEGARLDLLWEHRSGRVRADELKAGRAVQAVEAQSLAAQLARQLEAGAAAYGERFVGVRVLVLAAPSHSFEVTSADLTVLREGRLS